MTAYLIASPLALGYYAGFLARGTSRTFITAQECHATSVRLAVVLREPHRLATVLLHRPHGQPPYQVPLYKQREDHQRNGRHHSSRRHFAVERLRFSNQ